MEPFAQIGGVKFFLVSCTLREKSWEVTLAADPPSEDVRRKVMLAFEQGWECFAGASISEAYVDLVQADFKKKEQQYELELSLLKEELSRTKQELSIVRQGLLPLPTLTV